MKVSVDTFPHLSVLLVEDSEDNQVIIKYYLEAAKTQIDLAANGKEAFDHVTQNHYDLILMDLQMPVMDGYTATRDIRQWEIEQQRPPTPIIALTASSAEEELQKAMDAGCDAHLLKPLKKDILFNLLKELSAQATHLSHSVNVQEAQKTFDSQERYVAFVHSDLKDLVPKILEVKRQQIREIGNAIDQENFDEIKNLGHKMKGSHGLNVINTLAESIENAAQEGDLLSIQTIANELTSYLENIEIRFREDLA